MYRILGNFAVLGIVAVLLGRSAAAAANIPTPVISFAFDGNDTRLEVESGKIELVPGGIKGSALKTGDPQNRIFWRIPSSGFDLEKGTISFWFKPINWKDLKRYHFWLYTSSPAKNSSMNLVVLNYVDGDICFQLKDLQNRPAHRWNGFNQWENEKWYFVTVTWNHQSQAVYLNGELDIPGGGIQDISQSISITKDIFSNGLLYIGTASPQDWQGDRLKNGPAIETSLMDELEIRNVALDAEQVRQLYFEQKPAATSPPQQALAKSAMDCGLPFPKRPRLTVPLNAATPVIDGHVDVNEWADATCFTGLVDGDNGFLSDREFTGYLKSDGKKLYFAFTTRVHSIETLVLDHTERDSMVYLDDSWELYLYPNDGSKSYYQVVVNSAGAIFDMYRGDTKWNGHWEIQQRLVRPDIWDAELAIPLEDLGIKEPNEGELFMFGFFINQKNPENRSLCWTPQMGLFENASKSAVLDFSRSKPVIGLKSLGKINNGIPAPVIIGKGNVPEISVSLQTPQAGEIIKKIGSEQLGQAIQFPPLQGRGTALFTVTCPAGVSPEKADFYYSTAVRYDSIPLMVKSTNYPSRKEVCWEINYSALDQPEKVRKYKIDFGTESVICERKSQIPWEKVSVSTATLKPGEYKVQVLLLDADGQKIVAQSSDYTKEGNEPWLHNTVGIEKGYVPSPYTPMEIKDRTVNVIGRKMELGETGLPERITSAGVSLLTEPIQLKGEFDAKASVMTATEPFRFSTSQPDDSSGSASVTLGPLKGKLQQTISFDGFCWYEIELSAPGKVQARNVELEIRMPKDVAKSYLLTDTDYKAEKIEEWEVSDLLSKNLSLGLTPQVWLGNTKAGLAWIVESHKGWQVANESKTIEVLLEKDSVLLRVNIVDQPIEMTGSLKLAFGLQASPIKPVTDRQKRFVLSGRYPEYPAEAEVYGVYQGHNSAVPETFVSYAGLPEPSRPELALKEAQKQKKDGQFLTPYSEFTWLSLGMPEMKTYGGDWYLGQAWAAVAGMGANPEPFGLVDTENQDYQDFIVWRFIKNWDAYGGNSIYYDLFSPAQNKMPEKQKGYVTRSGSTAYPWPIRSVRAIARRLFIAYRQKNPNFTIFGHASNMYLPIMAFADAWPSGEYFVFVANRYPEVLSYDRYRSWFYAAPLGLRSMLLPSMKTPAQIRADMTHYLAGIVFNHNATFWLCFCDYGAVIPYLRVYHGGDWPVQEFLPYWEYPRLTNLDPNKFKVSGWFNNKTKKGLLCVASLSNEPVTASVKLGDDWKFSQAATLTDACKDLMGDGVKMYNMGSKFTDGNVEFKPYGVLMLNINSRKAN